MHIFKISSLETGELLWELLHDPREEIPFVTLYGTPHVWGWDMVRGALLKDGAPLLGESITIETSQ